MLLLDRNTSLLLQDMFHHVKILTIIKYKRSIVVHQYLLFIVSYKAYHFQYRSHLKIKYIIHTTVLP
jgi:hypothetical protein